MKKVLHLQHLSRSDQVLLCLACDVLTPKPVKTVLALATESGLAEAKRWNISDVLARAKGLALRTSSGWELTERGRQSILPIIEQGIGGPAVKAATSLRSHIQNIANHDVASFVEEAIKCIEAKCLRAAVVLSWAGAISVLREFVLLKRLADFNAEAKRRNAKWKPATGYDDFESLKEYDFLQILNGISMLGKSVKLELEARLKLRNACGHPTSLSLSEHMVSAHIESLILNVFMRFK
ncbi:hypothetical protein ACFLS5_01370 [Candidatus Bipolaricaulota bacterium]